LKSEASKALYSSHSFIVSALINCFTRPTAVAKRLRNKEVISILLENRHITLRYRFILAPFNMRQPCIPHFPSMPRESEIPQNIYSHKTFIEKSCCNSLTFHNSRSHQNGEALTPLGDTRSLQSLSQ